MMHVTGDILFYFLVLYYNKSTFPIWNKLGSDFLGVKMEGKHTLLYYPMPLARSLSVELCMVMGGVDYEVDIMPFEKWPETKTDLKKVPFGRMPVLTLPDGQLLSQTVAILYYVAQKAKMMYNDPIMDARVFELIFATDDIFYIFVKSVGKDEDTQKKMREDMFTGSGAVANHFELIDDSISRTSKGYAVGDRITIAD
eukprot:Lankesteria_metandrocarpae@DN512_c0_g1_i1.p2